jgi:hypothetical protein
MSDYEFYSIIISIFTAIGTFGATALALFFWFQGNKLKLYFHSMHAEGYGATPNIEGGYLVLKFTNMGYNPINLELAGVKFNDRRFFPSQSSIILCGHSNENLYNDSIPKLLQHGQSFIYAISWNDFVSLCKSMERKKFISIFVSVSSIRKDIKFMLSNHVLKKLKDDMRS